MLIKLTIKNYILIHELEIDFSNGFTVITGETGAGKSILLGALSLILGVRADSGILLDKLKKCVIEGVFSIKGYHLENFFESHELDYEDSIILRREINQHGKSRAFINDSPVILSMLKDLGDRLVNIHSQHSITTLNDSNFQLAVLDSFAGIQSDVAAYGTGYNQLVDLQKQLAYLENLEAKAAGEKDYFQFLFDELNLARLVSGEFSEIREQLDLLTHAGEIKHNLYSALQLLSVSEDNILEKLSVAGNSLRHIAKYKPELSELANRLNTNYIDIKDISNELAFIEEQVFVDPPKVELLTQRHDLLYRLMKKHQVSTVEELISMQLEIGKRISDEVGLAEQIANLHEEIARLSASMKIKAEILSVERKKFAPEFEKEVTGILAGLGISMARFRIEFNSSESLLRDGTDRVKFLFSANKGIELKDLSNVASGGELSRIMLAIKSMISQKNLLPTIIFDEIDNGVSGEIAGKVGAILKRMGGRMQVIAITHLPQIAAKGDRQYWVYKTEDKQVAATAIRPLSSKERIGEIAKMLSSETVTDAALKAAKELLNN